MNAVLENEKQAMLNAFERSTDNYWKTLSEISAAAGVKLENVIEIIFTSGDFVESANRTKNGQPVYTARKVYEKRAPFWQKLLAAFANKAAY